MSEACPGRGSRGERGINMRARMSWATISGPTMSWATIVALLLAAISVVVTLSLIDYPLGVAWDEVVKLVGVTKGRYINPVVRIVAMDGSVERLEKIAADIHAAAPGL